MRINAGGMIIRRSRSAVFQKILEHHALQRENTGNLIPDDFRVNRLKRMIAVAVSETLQSDSIMPCQFPAVVDLSVENTANHGDPPASVIPE